MPIPCCWQRCPRSDQVDDVAHTINSSSSSLAAIPPFKVRSWRATELYAKRTLNGHEIDAMIERPVAEKSLAEDRARNAAWQEITERAAQTAD
jgi:hypothetical protein